MSSLLLVRYFATTLSFACMYLGQGVIDDVHPPLRVAYFSFANSSSTRSGDMRPETPTGQRPVFFEIITSALLLAAFLPVSLCRIAPERC